MIKRSLTIFTVFVSIIFLGSEVRGNSNPSNQSEARRCPPGAPGVERLIEDFRRFPPKAVETGSLVIGSNRATRRVIRIGLPAVEPLLRASEAEDRVIAAYSIFSLGEIFSAANAKSLASIRPCKELVISKLQQLRNSYQKNARSILDFTVLGAIYTTMEKLGVPLANIPRADTSCCVTDVEIIGPEGTPKDFKGGKTMNDYYSDLVGAGFWKDNNKGGPFDSGNRVGVVIQFIGTCVGDRDRCRLTQTVARPKTTFPGEAQVPVATPLDDIKKSGRGDPNDPSNAAKQPSGLRQDIGDNQISFADPASYPYGGTTPNFEATKVFVTCVESRDRDSCTWDKCCIQWTWNLKFQNGAPTTNTLKADRKSCTKTF